MRGSIIFTLLLLLSCKTPEQTLPTQRNNISTPKTLTIILKINQGEKDTLPQINLHQKITAKGYLKKKTLLNQKKKEGCIIATFLNRMGKTIETRIIANPLQKEYEYNDEEGKFQHKELTLKEEYFSIRIQKIPNIFSVKLFLLHNDKQLLIQSIPLL